MAKIKVSILDTRKHIPELNCMSPVYAREIEDKKVAIIIRSGFTVVDASDLAPYGLDPTGEMPKKITRIAGPQASTESGASSQPGSTSGTEASGGARTRRSLRGSGLPPQEESPAPVTTGTTVTAESASGRAEESAEAAMARHSGTPVESIDHL
jgi:hypothetical protein|nr:MAG TPA: hypothetical protein [Caudoviricetes sp.]